MKGALIANTGLQQSSANDAPADQNTNISAVYAELNEWEPPWETLTSRRDLQRVIDLLGSTALAVFPVS